MEPKVIAEIGINHNGQIDLALEMVRKSYECGAHAVKFQKRDVKLVYGDVWDKPRNDGNPFGWTTYGEQKTGLEFGKEEYDRIDDLCAELGMEWFASAWDFESLKFLLSYKPQYMKIASAMTANTEFCNAVADQGIYTFISTGGMTWAEMDWIYDLFVEKRCPFCLMHCIALYPCPDNRCNIRTIAAMMDRYNSLEGRYKSGSSGFGCDIGWSGHEVGILPSVLAVANGASWIERHVTLDRSAYGSDQSASLEFQGLKRLVEYCELVEPILGTAQKRIGEDEKKVLASLRYWEK